MLLLGNLFSLMGCLLMVGVGFIKKKDRILYVQCAQFGLMGIGNFLLGATSGVVSNLISILRNLLFAKVKDTRWLKLVFIAVQILITLRTGIGAPIEWLPVLATVSLTWYLDTKDVVKFKVVCGAGLVMWAIYDLYYRNYAAFVFDILSLVSTVIGIVMVLKGKQASS